MDAKLPPVPDLTGKSDQEIKEMTQQLHDEVQRLGVENEQNQMKINQAKAEIRRTMPNVTAVEKLARRRQEQKEKEIRAKRKIVSIVQRYPGILEMRTAQVITNDISVMKRQLEVLNQRRQRAQEDLAKAEKRREELEQKRAGLKGDARRVEAMIQRRDHDKISLIRSLARERDVVEGMYQNELRAIDHHLRTLNQSATSFNGEFVKLRQSYYGYVNQRPSKLSTASPVVASASQATTTKRGELLTTVDAFLEFWGQRRMLKLWSDREELLTKAVSGTCDRRTHAYTSSKKLIESTRATEAELSRLKTVTCELKGQVANIENEITSMKAEIAVLLEKKANPNYTPEMGEKIASLKAELQDLERAAKIKELELRKWQGSNTGPIKSEACYVTERRRYRRVLSMYGILLVENDKLKKKTDTKVTTRELLDIHEQGVVVSEDGNDIFVHTATLPWVAKLLFHRAHAVEEYIKAVLVMIHGESKYIELATFVGHVVEAYEAADLDIRGERLRELVDTWKKWFPEDFQKETGQILSPFLNLLGMSGVFDPMPNSTDDVIWDPAVPFNEREQDLLFCADPLILAEHFTYHEMKIIQSMQPREFLNTAWTSLAKQELSPNVCRMIEHFNTVSLSIAASIVKQSEQSDRCRIIERWIQVMDAAREILNFQLVFEIVGALCNPAITRLKTTMASIDPDAKKTFDELRALTSPNLRFKEYRERLDKTAKQIAVPYIGPLLTSLVYCSDGNPSKTTVAETGEFQWNLSKFRVYAQIMNEICSPWASECKFVLNPELYRRVSTLEPPQETDGELFQLSQTLE